MTLAHGCPRCCWLSVRSGSGRCWPRSAFLGGGPAARRRRVRHLGFPHAAQALRITRWRREKNSRPSRETVYEITGLTAGQAGPAQLADLTRARWHVESKVRYVRDVPFGEDGSTVRTGNAPANLATIARASPTPYVAPATHSSRPADAPKLFPADALTLHGFP